MLPRYLCSDGRFDFSYISDQVFGSIFYETLGDQLFPRKLPPYIAYLCHPELNITLRPSLPRLAIRDGRRQLITFRTIITLVRYDWVSFRRYSYPIVWRTRGVHSRNRVFCMWGPPRYSNRQRFLRDMGSPRHDAFLGVRAWVECVGFAFSTHLGVSIRMGFDGICRLYGSRYVLTQVAAKPFDVGFAAFGFHIRLLSLSSSVLRRRERIASRPGQHLQTAFGSVTLYTSLGAIAGS